MKRTLLILSLAAGVSQATWCENHYQYTGPSKAKVAKGAEAPIPPPTAWVPPHRRPHYTVNRPILRLNASPGPVAPVALPAFAAPAFSAPAYSAPNYAAPNVNVGTGFSAPSFSAPASSIPNPSAVNAFTPPAFAAPTVTPVP
jgi:hypothetical protein